MNAVQIVYVELLRKSTREIKPFLLCCHFFSQFSRVQYLQANDIINMTKPTTATAAANKNGASPAKAKDQQNVKKGEEKRPEQREKSKGPGQKSFMTASQKN